MHVLGMGEGCAPVFHNLSGFFGLVKSKRILLLPQSGSRSTTLGTDTKIAL